MKFTLSWLRQYIEIEKELEVVPTLNRIGLEVDRVVDFGEMYKGCVVAEIQEVLQHPNADKLKVCRVFDGSDTLNIVCGASNVKANMKVVLAKVGAFLPCGIKIKKATIRGTESYGMICSDEELGLADESEGIKELTSEHKIGKAFLDEDVLIDIDITPNRGDCFSVYGVARELDAANLGRKKEVFTAIDSIKVYSGPEVKLSEDCPLFCAGVVRNVNDFDVGNRCKRFA